MSDPAESLTSSTLAGVNKLLHEPARLQITALLYTLESADFIFLMNQTGFSWGNLSTHLSKLEEAGYIEIEKTFKGKRPHTILRMTAEGREAFREYGIGMRQYFNDLPIQ